MLNEYQKARYEAFWHMDAIDSCLLHISCDQPDENGKYVLAEFYDMPKDKWFDIERRTQDLINVIKYAKFYGDGYFHPVANFGFGFISASYGGGFTLADGTTWSDHEPIFKDINNFLYEKDDHKTLLHEKSAELNKRWKELENDDFYIVDEVGMCFPLDTLSILYGMEQLSMMLYDEPDAVIRATSVLTERSIVNLNNIMKTKTFPKGLTCWWPVWSKEIFTALQCDFSAMISPAFFERFVLYDLTRKINALPRSMYHLDGQGQIPHLDYILAIKRLNCIQWIANGSSQPGCLEPCWSDDPYWYPLLKRIQNAGKGVVIASDKHRVEGLIQNLSTKGLFIETKVDDEYEANKLIEIAKFYGVK